MDYNAISFFMADMDRKYSQVKVKQLLLSTEFMTIFAHILLVKLFVWCIRKLLNICFDFMV